MDELVKLAAEFDKKGLWSEADKVDELITKMALGPAPLEIPAGQMVPDDTMQVRATFQEINNWLAQLWQTSTNIAKTLDLKKMQQVNTVLMSASSSLRTLAAQASDEADDSIVKEAAAKRFDVENAKKELKKKNEHQLERDTGFSWASRSMAAYELFLETKELSWLLRAEDLYGEACEHAAKAGDDGKSLAIVEKAVGRYKKKLPAKIKVAEPE